MVRSIKHQGNRDTSNWFITVKQKNNLLIKLWNKQYKKEYINGKFKKYFRMHEILCELYDKNQDIKNIIDSMEKRSESVPHRFKSGIYKDYMKVNRDDLMFKRPSPQGTIKIIKYIG